VPFFPSEIHGRPITGDIRGGVVVNSMSGISLESGLFFPALSLSCPQTTPTIHTTYEKKYFLPPMGQRALFFCTRRAKVPFFPLRTCIDSIKKRKAHAQHPSQHLYQRIKKMKAKKKKD
jgi:hypothetical protein